MWFKKRAKIILKIPDGAKRSQIRARHIFEPELVYANYTKITGTRTELVYTNCQYLQLPHGHIIRSKM